VSQYLSSDNRRGEGAGSQEEEEKEEGEGVSIADVQRHLETLVGVIDPTHPFIQEGEKEEGENDDKSDDDATEDDKDGVASAATPKKEQKE
jgi:hypothetical protein